MDLKITNKPRKINNGRRMVIPQISNIEIGDFVNQYLSDDGSVVVAPVNMVLDENHYRRINVNEMAVHTNIRRPNVKLMVISDLSGLKVGDFIEMWSRSDGCLVIRKFEE
jgi:hypothetical protein